MDKAFDVGIVGAGVAGSCLAILLARQGFSVVIFEKDLYPKHKVCGEFLSKETEPFLLDLGIDLSSERYPRIHQLRLTGVSGYSMGANLKMGGIGISRYDLDKQLMDVMKANGVAVKEGLKVNSLDRNIIEADKNYSCKLIISAHGKYRSVQKGKNQSNRKSKNYVGIKHHIKIDGDGEEIALHSFPGGYCGMSQVEEGRFCLCYLVDSQLLKKHGASIEALEQHELSKNPSLKRILEKSEKLFDAPLAISNIQFHKKGVENDGVLQVGDAAGSISPLAGNGMSMAARSAKILAELISNKKLNHEMIAKQYNHQWDQMMGKRVKMAGVLNTIMLNRTSHEITLRLLNHLGILRNAVVESMQGDVI